MGKIQALIDSREIVRCDNCLLVQFRPHSNYCRRCQTSLDETRPRSGKVSPARSIPIQGMYEQLNLATSIRSLRLRSKLSQKQLARRMSVPRTYITKIENEKSAVTLSSLKRLARALEVTVPSLLSSKERTRQEEILELMEDKFIAELLPSVSRLNHLQRTSILTVVKGIAVPSRGQV